MATLPIISYCLMSFNDAVMKMNTAVQRRLHIQAELALMDPTSDQRKQLVQFTIRHPNFAEKYGTGSPLGDHPLCAKNAADCSLDEQKSRHLVLAVDCEMVQTVSDDMALARVSAVDVSGSCVLDFLVMACNDKSYIEDTREGITGLTRGQLQKEGVSLEEARDRFASVCFRDTVLIGHALDHDLLALELSHDLIIDTCMLYPVEGCATYTHSLEYLTRQVLKRQMSRDSKKGVHDSLEDAINSLDLVKYVACRQFSLGVLALPPPIMRRPRTKFKGSLPLNLDQFRPTSSFYKFELWSRARISELIPIPNVQVQSSQSSSVTQPVRARLPPAAFEFKNLQAKLKSRREAADRLKKLMKKSK